MNQLAGNNIALDPAKERLIQVAWRPNKAGKLHPLLYAPSLWRWMDSLPQSGPAREEGDQ